MTNPNPETKSEEDLSELDTYQRILSSITHPIRRSILRQLADGDKTYTELMQNQNVESGHLAYHLRYLGDLINQKDGKYSLSKHGGAAVTLMQRVEGRTQKIWIDKEVQAQLQHMHMVKRVERFVNVNLLGYGIILLAIALALAFINPIIIGQITRWQLATTGHAEYISWPSQGFTDLHEVITHYPHYWLSIPIQVLGLIITQLLVFWQQRRRQSLWWISTTLAIAYIAVFIWLGLTGPSYILTQQGRAPLLILDLLYWVYLPIIFLSLVYAAPHNLRERIRGDAMQHLTA